MGTTLSNGVYLPDEGERNCYAGLKVNWEILNQKVADISALQSAIAGALHREIVASLPTTDIDTATIYMILNGTSATENVYDEYMYVNNAWELIGTSATDLTNYYTKAEVDGKLLLKASASDLTSHTGDTTIHVTASDKAKWNNGASQAYVVRYASVAVSDNSTVPYTDLNNTDNIKVNDLLLDTNGKLYQISSVDTVNETVSVTTPLTQLAVDSSVVHNTGNEKVNGIKTFKDMIPIDGDYLGDEASTNQRTNICLRANRDTADKSCAYITRFRQNRAQGALQPLDLQKIGFDVLENEVRTNNVFDIQCTDWLNDVPQKVNMVSGAQSYSYGTSGKKALFNDLNPGSLSLPDLNNGIDISGYVTVVANANKESLYTPPDNGWICVRLSRTSGALGVLLIQGDLAISGKNIEVESGATTADATLPVVGGVQVSINSALADGVVSAKFYPCLGNV